MTSLGAVEAAAPDARVESRWTRKRTRAHTPSHTSLDGRYATLHSGLENATRFPQLPPPTAPLDSLPRKEYGPLRLAT